MKNLKRLISLLLMLTILLSLFPAIANAKTTKKVNLTISAAASLTDAMTEIAKEYKKEKPNVTLTFNYGSSGALQQQIEQGSPVDVFLSAATKQIDTLKTEKLLIDSSINTFAYNDLVLIVPIDSTLSISDFKDLGKSSVKTVALGETTSVPAGQYAEQALTYYGVLTTVKAKAVYAKDVREVLTWVESGNADAGVVYKTDALTSDQVKIVATAPNYTHTIVSYPGAVVKDSKYKKEAKAFLKYLSGSKAKKILESYGFK